MVPVALLSSWSCAGDTVVVETGLALPLSWGLQARGERVTLSHPQSGQGGLPAGGGI